MRIGHRTACFSLASLNCLVAPWSIVVPHVMSMNTLGSQSPHNKANVIAVDGPAASGKGTLSRRLSSRLRYAHLDTGSLYRATALRLVRQGHDASSSLDNDAKVAVEQASTITPQDLTDPDLRLEKVGEMASVVSQHPNVRKALLDYQAEARAKRRWKEVVDAGRPCEYEEVLEALVTRDKRDSDRADAPLKAASDAVTIDTSELDQDAVFEAAWKHVTERFPNAAVS